jgi:glyoxylase-like metal-dependent hydrolase (beta-lactamase superfamily II)
VRTEVFAVRYGSVSTTRGQTFLRYEQYGEPDTPMTMDYFVWLVRSPHGTTLIDTGFDPAVGRRRGRSTHLDPADAPALVGIGRDEIEHLVITHFHYDHIGNLHRFPGATVSVQAAELEFWSNRSQRQAGCWDLVEPQEIEYMLREAVAGRVRQLAGDARLTEDISVRLIGGHTPGQQVVIVHADRPIVIASDAVHFYEEMERDRPFRHVVDPPAMVAGYAFLRDMEMKGAVIVAGHDPLVACRFQPVAGVDPQLAVRVNVD